MAVELKPIPPDLANQLAAPLEYSSFPFWHALLVEPNREAKSADVLHRIGMFCYLPMFTKQHRLGGAVRARRARLHAVVPGMLFLPTDFMDIGNRDKIFDWARVRAFVKGQRGDRAILTKENIEIIREIEAKLNLPPERKGVLFQVGQRVRFKNELYAAFWGVGTIYEVVKDTRIGVEVDNAIGGPTKLYVPASEIEAM